MGATLVVVVSAFAVGISAGMVGIATWQVLRRINQQRAEIAAARHEVQQSAIKIVAEAKLEAKSEAETILKQARKQAESERGQKLAIARVQAREAKTALALDVRRRHGQLREQAEASHRRARELEQQAQELDQRETQLAAKEKRAAERQKFIDAAHERHRAELERVAGLSSQQARGELVTSITADAKRDAAVLVRDLENQARTEGERRAREVIVEAISRVASEQTAESVVSVVTLPNEEMKGRIIGREGRNIRTFEAVTGVNVIIDDTPEAALLSCFDPVRREVGRLTLEALVADGRIHPHRIEEAYEHSLSQVDQVAMRAGEDALLQVGIVDMHPGLVKYLGKLRYRTSYGQNVLKHLIESAHIAGVMAAELGLNVSLIKRCAFMHDIGKALTHEVEGSHAIIGADLARRYGESPEVVHAIEAHHNEVAPTTIEAVLTQAADACSGGRPGARRESLELYVKRLERIEQIAQELPGVEKVFAMQAGREVRIMVSPHEVDDAGAYMIARDVASQIERELTYPGQIRVTVVRESRATEVAH